MRVYNFCAGPALLPLPVLDEIRADLPEWQGSGMSVLEVSHRGAPFRAVLEEAEALLRRLLAVPADYRVLFVAGGAAGQFAALPMNLAAEGASADYLDTGAWSRRAAAEARRFLPGVRLMPERSGADCLAVPAPASIRPARDAAYLHYTANETINGVEFGFVPDGAGRPLVGDLTSTLMSRPLPVERFGVIYAGCQKNLGVAGLTVVIVRADLLGRARRATPSIWDYAALAAAGSLVNTPPTFAIYVMGLVLRWLAGEGGLVVIAERNRAKAARLYAAIDASALYRNPVDPGSRSWMNVPFTLTRPQLEPLFLEEARAAGLVNLAGHRSVGGLRASLYNAMPEAGVAALVDFMRDFEQRHAAA